MNKTKYYLIATFALAVCFFIYIWNSTSFSNQEKTPTRSDNTSDKVTLNSVSLPDNQTFSSSNALLPSLSEDDIIESTRTQIETDDGLIYTDFNVRPFPVYIETDHYQWTANDGMQPSAMDLLAHNDPERKRLSDLNSFIHRRQLIYQKNSFLSQATKTPPPSSIILPGFDGTEFKIDLEKIDLNQPEEDVEGILQGHVEGYPNSKVIISFAGEVASGYMVVPEKDIYIEFDPREANQLMLNAINMDAEILK